MKALDLFCGAGGASMGLHRAGFDVLGIDHKPQPRYPFSFIQADALRPPVMLEDFDLIWASPPCQAYIRGGTVNKNKAPRLIEPVRAMLMASGSYWVIENVEGSPLRSDLKLCGSHFNLAVRRHRIFETNWHLFSMLRECDHSKPVAGVYGNPHGKRGAWPGMLPSDLSTWSDAMGIDWMSAAEITQAVPPAYSEFIAKEFLAHIGRFDFRTANGTMCGSAGSGELPIPTLFTVRGGTDDDCS